MDEAMLSALIAQDLHAGGFGIGHINWRREGIGGTDDGHHRAAL